MSVVAFGLASQDQLKPTAGYSAQFIKARSGRQPLSADRTDWTQSAGGVCAAADQSHFTLAAFCCKVTDKNILSDYVVRLLT